jgi:hypothetical protein
MRKLIFLLGLFVVVPAYSQNKFITQSGGKLKGSTAAQELAVGAEFGNGIWLMAGAATTNYSTIAAALGADTSTARVTFSGAGNGDDTVSDAIHIVSVRAVGTFWR